MSLVSMTKWRTLVLATAAFNLAFLVWFSFSPFTGPIAEAFGLSLGEIGLLASAAIWLAPPGRIVTGWLTDRFGASTVFTTVLGYVGVASIVSAFAQTYELFFVARLVVGSAGIAFVIGIQHVSQWFPEEQLGTAEGIYAGVGSAGAGAGALVLPRFFSDWSGPLFGAGWRAAFFYTGCLTFLMAITYALLGEDAATQARAAQARESATLKSWLHTATRYGIIALALGYVASFGIELSLNGWLPTYFREGFGSDLVRASTFAAMFSLGAGTLRPLGGWISDILVRRERNILPIFQDRYREQWTIVCLGTLVVMMCAFTVAGRTGVLPVTVGIVFCMGMCCGITSGAIFAQVPAMFPHRSGAAAGIVGGVGTLGGISFPLVYSTAATAGYIHSGYLIIAVCLLPIILVNAWVAQPARAVRAHIDGVVSVTPANTSDHHLEDETAHNPD
ncbi:nitrate/nitrite transporter [Halocatena salina]|uniref:NarK/NasA family nitrate transporter n=1 Tax=Halocatena salina TaxID=2934340 RepID=A0A8U0A5D6_9EURY|nr:NarK/NasA family nitrate transporter [Halocatena salina]UPM44076.1 NarK/NasA family nitrate transporter [Halocatena salina]